MPIKPIIYLNTIIYKIVHKEDYDNVNIYVGSTTNFKTRKNSHKSRTNKIGNAQYNFKKYQYIRDNGGWDMFDMIEIEKYPCNDKNEAESRERYWIEFYKSTLNCNIPTRSQKEYININKEKIAEKAKIYCEKNKEKINEKSKIHYEKNKVKISERMKEYNKKNKKEISENKKIYNNNHKKK